MSIIANYHTHNRLCNHAEGRCEDYVKKAIELRMEELGLSDHDPIPEHFMTNKEYLDNWCQRNMKLDEFKQIYLPEMQNVIKKYSNQIKIYKGLECEFLPEQIEYYKELKSHLDYMNLGVHFFRNQEGNIINSYADLTNENIDEYATACVKGMASGLFQILVHPDLFMFGYRGTKGERVFDEACEKASRKIIEASIRYGVYLELNCNGLANTRKYHATEWLYPNKNFWSIAKTYPNVKMIIGIDAHHPDSLDNADLDAVVQFASDLALPVSQKVQFNK